MVLTKTQQSLPDSLVCEEIISQNPEKAMIIKASDEVTNERMILKAHSNKSLMFQREVHFLSQIEHQNIIKLKYHLDNVVFDNEGDESDMLSVMALEYASFGDLFDLTEKHGPLPERLAYNFFNQMVKGVAHLHKNNIAHLDLKLENLLLGSDMKVKLNDFDLAQNLDEEE